MKWGPDLRFKRTSYERLLRYLTILPHYHMVTAETYPYFTCFVHIRSQFREKSTVLPIEEFSISRAIQ